METHYKVEVELYRKSYVFCIPEFGGLLCFWNSCLLSLERSTRKDLEDVDLEGKGGGPSTEIWGYSSLHRGPST